MKIFLDTASLPDIEWAVRTGLIDGVTTNPSLLALVDPEIDPRAHLGEICRVVSGPVGAEVVAVDAEGMYREGRDLARIADNIVVMIPMIEDGIGATRRLAAEGVRVCSTLIFTSAQALLAAKAGARFVSPFISRLEDIGQDGVTVVRDVREVFTHYSMECEILAASIANALHFMKCARIGADAATVPPSVLKALLIHPLTDRGVDQFLSDWSKRVARARSGVSVP
jgi:transaldolase